MFAPCSYRNVEIVATSPLRSGQWMSRIAVFTAARPSPAAPHDALGARHAQRHRLEIAGARGAADHQAEFAGLDAELHIDVMKGEVFRRDVEIHRGGLAGLERHAPEPLQLLHGTRHAAHDVADVE